VDLNQLLD